ncbi:hypothetical protein ACVWC7_24130, partial [Escherichia coli]|uniref:hypothetical protein n=3 Tax=Escherichia coli TaxID=562 RepID=UPI001BD3265E
TTGIMKAFKFSFLLLSNEYFHVGQHDLLLLKNQASSMITGIYLKISHQKNQSVLFFLVLTSSFPGWYGK